MKGSSAPNIDMDMNYENTQPNINVACASISKTLCARVVTFPEK
jgi:hypothetical protein